MTDANSVLFKAIFSNAWENINQNFYTQLAQSIDPIDSTITFYAGIISSGRLISTDKDGNEVENDELIKLLNKPNEFQNFNEFIKEWLYYHYSHGWNYVVPKSSSTGFEKKLGGTTKNYLYNTDPDEVKFKTSIIDNALNFLGFIRDKRIAFDYKPLGFINHNFNDVIYFVDVRQNSKKPYVGVSRLLSLQQQIQNFSLALQGKENLIKRSGSTLVSLDKTNEDIGLDASIGIGRFDKDGTPEMTTHKAELEKQIRETTLTDGSKGIIFSTLALKSQPLSSGLENIKFDDLAIEDARQILNKYNLPKEFQNLTKESAKFQNRQLAMIEVIQNTIEPLGNSFCSKIRDFYGWENEITLDFTHLPIFSENENTKVSTQQAIVNLYSGLLEKKQITEEEFNQILVENGIKK